MRITKLVLLTTVVFLPYSTLSADDAGVVTAIFEANKKTNWVVSDCAKFEDGRIVELNLTNKVPEQDGLVSLGQEIGQLSELRVLILNDNDLAVLPKELYSCTKLVHLEAESNNITEILPGISRLVNLKHLDLMSNQIRVLPEEIGRLRNLQFLKLWNNYIEKIPSEIGEIPALRELYLKGNKLSTLPLSLTKSKLKYIDVLDNYICEPPAAIDAWLKKFDDKYKSLQKCLGDKRFK